MAVSAKSFSQRLALRADEQFGSVFDDFLNFIKELIPIITAFPCFMAAKRRASKIAEAIDDEMRAVSKKKAGRCKKPVRKLLARYGVDDSDRQDKWWKLICEEGFADASNVATFLVSASPA